MSKVARRFWNSPIHKRLDAQQRLKALGILTGDEAQTDLIKEVAEITRKHFAPALTKALFTRGPDWLDLLKKRG